MDVALDKLTLTDLLAQRFLLTSEYDAREDEIRHLKHGEGRENPGTALNIERLEEIQRQKELAICALNAQINKIRKSNCEEQPSRLIF